MLRPASWLALLSRTFTFELSLAGSPRANVEYDYVGKQSIPTTGLSPASPTALWAAVPDLTPSTRSIESAKNVCSPQSGRTGTARLQSGRTGTFRLQSGRSGRTGECSGFMERKERKDRRVPRLHGAEERKSGRDSGDHGFMERKSGRSGAEGERKDSRCAASERKDGESQLHGAEERKSGRTGAYRLQSGRSGRTGAASFVDHGRSGSGRTLKTEETGSAQTSLPRCKIIARPVYA